MVAVEGRASEQRRKVVVEYSLEEKRSCAGACAGACSACDCVVRAPRTKYKFNLRLILINLVGATSSHFNYVVTLAWVRYHCCVSTPDASWLGRWDQSKPRG